MFYKILLMSFIITQYSSICQAMNSYEKEDKFYRNLRSRYGTTSFSNDIKINDYFNIIDDLQKINIPVVSMEYPIKEFKDPMDNEEFFQKYKSEHKDFIKSLHGPAPKISKWKGPYTSELYNYANIRLNKIFFFEKNEYAKFARDHNTFKNMWKEICKREQDLENQEQQQIIEFEKEYTSFPRLEDDE